eukprot:TRINITY_DN12079_c0_g1_i1.p1 TRINITY_DN12079_c0_g1~~TRINITY_DN12079_c0_g1_i1.p1  ORF type:complete len:556 (+),score=117.45 TRINITY_DN12079_c0_g1_i1:89-1756(+)
MATAHGMVPLREWAASDAAGGCDPAGGGGADSAADTEERAKGQRPLKPPLRECSAPPPRRPAVGRLPSARATIPGTPPAAPRDAPHKASPLSPQGDVERVWAQPPEEVPDHVERLTAEIRTLKASLAAAGVTISELQALNNELQAALAAATARQGLTSDAPAGLASSSIPALAAPESQGAASSPAAGSFPPPSPQSHAGRSATPQQAHPAGPAPAVQPAGGGAQEQGAPKKKHRTRRRHRSRRQQPEPEEGGEEAQEPEEPEERAHVDEAAAWADDWESQEEDEPDAAPPRITTLAPPPPHLPCSTLTAAPTQAAEPWVCCSCGVYNYNAASFCGSPQCGRPRLWPVAPAEAQCVDQEDYYQQQVGIAPQCVAPAPPPQRQPPPRKIHSQPCSVPMLVPLHPACPPPVPEPCPDDRYAMGVLLHPRVAEWCPARADHITGMMLELGPTFCQHLLSQPDQLAREVQLAWQTLVDAECPRRMSPAPPTAYAPSQAPALPRGQQNKVPSYVPSHLRRQPAAAQPAAPAPAPAPAPPRAPRAAQNVPYVPPYARRRQGL